MIVWGPGFRTAGHRHHCVQLVMAMQGSLLIRASSVDPWMRCGAALVKPDAAHEVDARDNGVVIGFVDSESELGAALSERIHGWHRLCFGSPSRRLAHSSGKDAY